jgi:hypothetical protein
MNSRVLGRSGYALDPICHWSVSQLIPGVAAQCAQRRVDALPRRRFRAAQAGGDLRVAQVVEHALHQRHPLCRRQGGEPRLHRGMQVAGVARRACFLSVRGISSARSMTIDSSRPRVRRSLKKALVANE